MDTEQSLVSYIYTPPNIILKALEGGGLFSTTLTTYFEWPFYGLKCGLFDELLGCVGLCRDLLCVGVCMWIVVVAMCDLGIVYEWVWVGYWPEDVFSVVSHVLSTSKFHYLYYLCVWDASGFPKVVWQFVMNLFFRDPFVNICEFVFHNAEFLFSMRFVYVGLKVAYFSFVFSSRNFVQLVGCH